MMELDEAIRHAEEKAEELENQCALWKRLADERGLTLVSDYEPCKKCAAEHRQLAEWLKELKRVRELPWLKELKELREQKRPHGEWIFSGVEHISDNPIDSDTYYCSICKRSISTTLTRPEDLFPFCHCGADMRKKEGDGE